MIFDSNQYSTNNRDIDKKSGTNKRNNKDNDNVFEPFGCPLRSAPSEKVMARLRELDREETSDELRKVPGLGQIGQYPVVEGYNIFNHIGDRSRSIP